MGNYYLNAQTKIFKGKIFADGDVDGVHIMNVTSNTFTTSNSNGDFSITAKIDDELVFSALAYQLKNVVVTETVFNSDYMIIYLDEKVNILDEIVIGKILTGDLRSDLTNLKVKRSIDFYDLGIPGNQNLPKTQSERRLYTAGDFKPIHLLALLGGSLDVDPILNAISGRTKLLKSRVRLEKLDTCVDNIKSDLSETLFSAIPLDDDFRTEFFNFCEDDPQFENLCAMKNDFKTFEFLKEKLISFKAILSEKL